MQNDLAAFLRARLDEDEAAAKTAQLRFPPPWDQAEATESPLPAAVSVFDSNDESFAVTRGSYVADYIARHDPARVLREVAAKRAILAMHQQAIAHKNGPVLDFCVCQEEDGVVYGRWPCETLRQLAAVWSDHPDYDPTWAV